MESSSKSSNQSEQNFVNLLSPLLMISTLFAAWCALNGGSLKFFGFLLSLAFLSFMAFLYRHRWPLAQRVILLTVAGSLIYSTTANHQMYFGEVNAKGLLLIGNAIGLIELLLIIAFKDMRLRSLAYLTILTAKVFGVQDELHVNSEYATTTILMTTLGMLFSLYKDMMEKDDSKIVENSAQVQEEKIKTQTQPLSNTPKENQVVEDENKLTIQDLEKLLEHDSLPNLESKQEKANFPLNFKRRTSLEKFGDELQISRGWFNLNQFLEEIKSFHSTHVNGVELIISKEPEMPNIIFNDKYILLEVLVDVLDHFRKFDKIVLRIGTQKTEDQEAEVAFIIEGDNCHSLEKESEKLQFGATNNLLKLLNNNSKQSIQNVVNMRIDQEKTQISFAIGICVSLETNTKCQNNEKIISISRAMTSSTWYDESSTPIFDIQEKARAKRMSFQNNEIDLSPIESVNDLKKEDDLQELIDRLQMRPKNVLIIDSNSTGLKETASSMEKLGFIPYMAFNGNEGLELVKESLQTNLRYDFIIMNIDMPLLNGLEVSNEIKAKIDRDEMYPVPIIALTSKQISREEEERLKEFGISCMLEKPLRLEEVSMILEALVA